VRFGDATLFARCALGRLLAPSDEQHDDYCGAVAARSLIAQAGIKLGSHAARRSEQSDAQKTRLRTMSFFVGLLG
jgi:hypothetical protein